MNEENHEFEVAKEYIYGLIVLLEECELSEKQYKILRSKLFECIDTLKELIGK